MNWIEINIELILLNSLQFNYVILFKLIREWRWTHDLLHSGVWSTISQLSLRHIWM